MTLGRETATARAAEAATGLIGELNNFNRAGAVRQTADEAALLERGNEAVNARFRAQVERILHLVEGGRNPGFLQPLMNKSQQFVLFARQHRGVSPGAVRFRSRARPIQSNCSAGTFAEPVRL